METWLSTLTAVPSRGLQVFGAAVDVAGERTIRLYRIGTSSEDGVHGKNATRSAMRPRSLGDVPHQASVRRVGCDVSG